jgi:hypothetical protein
MDTKLTLNVDSELVKKAKLYAKKDGRSLSDLVESYFKVLTRKKESKEDFKVSQKVKSLSGSFKVPQDFDYKKELQNRISDKYL